MKITFVKEFNVTWNVYVDGVKTDDKETRVKMLFRRDAVVGGLAQPQFGSIVTVAGMEDVARAYWKTDTDYSALFTFAPIEGSDFYKVVLK